MKRSILSPLCSAFIIPGLGQIVNDDYKKGLIILAAVFLLFVAGTIKLVLIINSLIGNNIIELSEIKILTERIQEQDLSVLWILVILFGFVWFYSVLDAFLQGRKIDKEKEGGIQ
jgi:hypothetical protein